jgi:hypothetical protein
MRIQYIQTVIQSCQNIEQIIQCRSWINGLKWLTGDQHFDLLDECSSRRNAIMAPIFGLALTNPFEQKGVSERYIPPTPNEPAKVLREFKTRTGVALQVIQGGGQKSDAYSQSAATWRRSMFTVVKTDTDAASYDPNWIKKLRAGVGF